MITELHIRNFAIIDEVHLEFVAPGLNVLTGETGSGKSIILGAMACILGERASPELVRSGAERCSVEAVLTLPLSSSIRSFLETHDLAAEEGAGENGGLELIIRRDIHADGRSRAYINGHAVPLNQLKELGDMLVDLHGQHQHQSLLRTDAQLDWLDKSAGTQDLLLEFTATYRRYLELMREREEITRRERERRQRLDFLRFQIEEIEEANLVEGEEEALELEKKRLSNLERLRERAGAAMARLSDENVVESSVQGLVGEALRALQPLAGLDSDIQAAVDALSGAQSLINEALARLAAAAEISADPERLDFVVQRLELWQHLKRKFGADYHAIMVSLGELKDEFRALMNAEERRDALSAEIAAGAEALKRLAAQLTASRRKTARKLEKAIDREMTELGMNGAAMAIRLIPHTRGTEVPDSSGAPIVLTASGAESIEFFISTNPGEEPKPLRRIASGGEISRIMLALKTVLAGQDDIPALVFDEIDAGLGGQTAAVVGEKLRRLGRSHQVICITHSASIAAHGDRHFAIEKTLNGGRAVTQVRMLRTAVERTEEIARLLDGNKVSDLSRRHARRLLDACRGK